MWSLFLSKWVYGGAVAGLFLLLLLPLMLAGHPAAVLLSYLFLPAYMLHQVEEHDRDRFRLFVNERLGKGLELVTPFSTMFINVAGVWGVLLIVLYLCAFADPGFGLIGVYLLLVNTLAHLGSLVALRCYNPGLVTAIVLFVPLGGYGAYVMSSATAAPVAFNLLGLALAVAIHAGIIVHVKLRARKLASG